MTAEDSRTILEAHIEKLEGELDECRRLLDIADALLHHPTAVSSYLHQIPIAVVERMEQFERGIREDRQKR